VTDRSINCHLAQSAMDYLFNYTQPTKTISIRTQLEALYGHFNTITYIIEKNENRSITIEV